MKNIEKYMKEVMNRLDYCGLETDLTSKVAQTYCEVNCCNTCKNRVKEWLLSEYKEDILDAVERKYLSDVIKPFVHNVTYIVKRLNRSGYYIAIVVNKFDVINLPYFANNTMYKGMKVDRRYTLKELGI